MSGGDDLIETAKGPSLAETERLAYSIQEAADLLGVHYFSIYRLIQRGKLRACRALRGKLLVPRSELLRLLAPPEDQLSGRSQPRSAPVGPPRRK